MGNTSGNICMRAFAVVMLTVPTLVLSQRPPPEALINQESEETQEAARAASLRSAAETLALFEEDAGAAIERALEVVWDPERPREPGARTPWGDPDISGYWLNATYTPLERPDELHGQALYSIPEAIEAFQRAVTTDAGIDPATVHYDWTEFGMDNWQSPIKPNRRTSLIVDPPDGKIPALTPEGQARWEAHARRDYLLSRGITERCIAGSEGPPRLPFVQQIGESRFVQTPDYVVMIAQNNSDVRVIPLDGRPPLSEKIRNWLGEPRGHWDGDTLVVETTNFHPERRWNRPRGVQGDLHLVERFTKIDPNTMLYQATITDPTTFVEPWTLEIPWPRMDPPGLFEFACHEHNYGIINVVQGAQIRAAEYEAGLVE